jgi:hypothetical protein
MTTSEILETGEALPEEGAAKGVSLIKIPAICNSKAQSLKKGELDALHE